MEQGLVTLAPDGPIMTVRLAQPFAGFMELIKRACYLVAATAFLLAAAIPAHAQLALSYKLEVRSPRVEQPEVVVSPCAGLNWMTSIGACGRELFSRVSQAPHPENLAVFEPAPVTAATDLSAFGRTTDRDSRPLRA